ncbi:helix-turn-helix transcriptional regulator [Pseudomonas aeruginosa]
MDNERIRRLLDVKAVWASRLMGELTARMEGRAARSSAHAPLTLLRADTDRLSPDEYLNVISTHHDDVVGTLIEDARMDLSSLQRGMFTACFSAARRETGLRIVYRSMSTPTGSERTVYPHSLIRAPRRWHMRAWCEERKGFRDFTLGRIAAAEPLDTPAPYRRGDDKEWNNILELVIVAHPGLSPDQQEMIAAENFPGARARRLKVRQCLASYIIQDLRLALDPVKHPIPEYQLMVGNADKLPPLFVSGL